jgi:hypothetical protein
MNPTAKSRIMQELFEQINEDVDEFMREHHPEVDAQDYGSEPEWAERLFREVAEFIADLTVTTGGHFWPDEEGSVARQAWFGEDFNYPYPDYRAGTPSGTNRQWVGDRWNSAFSYNASEGMLGLIRAVNYEFARRGYLPPHSVGKNRSDFQEGGNLH